MACNHDPDAENEADINSFISTWSDAQQLDLQKTIAESDYANGIIKKLEAQAAEANANGDTTKYTLCVGFVEKMQTLIRDKIDATSSHILQYYDETVENVGQSDVKLEAFSNWVKTGLWINMIPKGSRTKKIDFPSLNITLDVPKPIAIQHLALRVVYVPFDDRVHKSTASRDRVLGGVFSIELLALPDEAKKIKGWTIREMEGDDQSVTRIRYPAEGMVASAVQPIRVQVSIPNNMVLDECPRVGWWDEAENQWNEDGISEISLHKETDLLMLHFHTTKLTYLAILQEKNLNFHRLKWKLQVELNNSWDTDTDPIGQLFLSTATYSRIHIEIRYDKCRLRYPKLAELQDLSQNYFSPGELLNKLALAGINITPSSQDDKTFHHLTKEETLEDKLISEICSVASAFEISSHDPQSVPEDWHFFSKQPTSAVFQVKALTPPPLTTLPEEPCKELEEKPRHVLAIVDPEAPNGGIKFRVEPDSELSNGNWMDNIYENHVYLRNALKSITTPDTDDRLQSSSVVFENTLKQLLHLIRPFSYCQPERNVSSEQIQEPVLEEISMEVPAAEEIVADA